MGEGQLYFYKNNGLLQRVTSTLEFIDHARVENFLLQDMQWKACTCPITTPSVTYPSSNHGLLACPSIPSTHKELDEPLPVACLRNPWVSVLSRGRGVVIRQESTTWGPGLTSCGLGDMDSVLVDCTVERRVRTSGSLFSVSQSTMGMLLYQGRFWEIGYLSELACV